MKRYLINEKCKQFWMNSNVLSLMVSMTMSNCMFFFVSRVPKSAAVGNYLNGTISYTKNDSAKKAVSVQKDSLLILGNTLDHLQLRLGSPNRHYMTC